MKDSAVLDLKLVRDYDRSRSVAEQMSTDTFSIKSTGGHPHTGTLSLYGHFFRDSTWRSNSPDVAIWQDSLPVIIGKCADKFHQEDLGMAVYVSIETTNRQTYRNQSVTRPEKVDTFFDKRLVVDDFCDTLDFDKYIKRRLVGTTRDKISAETVYLTSKTDSICLVSGFLTSQTFDKPEILLTAEDISKAVEIIYFTDTAGYHINSRQLRSITINYKGAAEFGKLIPAPDVHTMNAIRFTDAAKIDEICSHGLSYHVSFPDMENIQDVRIFGLTMIIAMLVGVFFGLLYKLIARAFHHLWQHYPTWSLLLVLVLIAALSAYGLWLSSFTNVNSRDVQYQVVNPLLEPQY